jgi:hypothetical protein
MAWLSPRSERPMETSAAWRIERADIAEAASAAQNLGSEISVLWGASFCCLHYHE